MNLPYPTKTAPITSLGKSGTARQDSPATYELAVPTDAAVGTGRVTIIYRNDEDSMYPRTLRVLNSGGTKIYEVPEQPSLTCNFRVGDPLGPHGEAHYYSTGPGKIGRIELTPGATYTFQVENGKNFPASASKGIVVEVYAKV